MSIESKALIAVLAVVLTIFQTSWQAERTPNLSFEPKGSGESQLIRYISWDAENRTYFTNRLDQFLQPYLTPSPDEGYLVRCAIGEPPQKGSNAVCDFEVHMLYSCVASQQYGFKREGPCIFLALDKIAGWIPDYYNSSTMPELMPDYLKQHIIHEENIHGTNANILKTVWVTCKGEHADDIANIGSVTYYPRMGFGGQYFPFSNQDGYLSPLVAVHFDRLARGVVINIKCQAWAANINHDQGQGSVHFQIHVDYLAK